MVQCSHFSWTDRMPFDEAERKGIQIRGPINSRWKWKVLRGMGTCMDAYSMDHNMLDWEESEENMATCTGATEEWCYM